jgi:hypothetical protein
MLHTALCVTGAAFRSSEIISELGALQRRSQHVRSPDFSPDRTGCDSMVLATTGVVGDLIYCWPR